MEISFKESARKIVLILLTISIPVYLIWRIFFTFNVEFPFFSSLFLLADLITCFATFGFAISLWNLKKHHEAFELKEGLKVDVWIPTYNESVDLLRRTIYHAVKMDYPHKTYVLDDGKREEVRKLAESLGAIYLSREKNLHAKAGNLNYAFKMTKGDFIASFDADFIPQKDFLTKLLGYFKNENVALVQTPQEYYNSNSFQHKKNKFFKKIWSEQDSFFNLIMNGRNNLNSAFWVGSNAIMRRTAIESIGGFPTDSVVEDMLTSILIHDKKWKTIYVDKPLAYGLAPSSLGYFLTQRLRWARGVSQILKKQNPIFKKGLTFIQKFFYLSSIAHFFEGTSRLIYYFIPALYLLFGIVPIKPSFSIIFIIFSYLFFVLISLFIITKGKSFFYNNELYGMIRYWVYFIGNLEIFFKRKLKFAVTPKGDSKKVQLKSIFGPALVFLINFSATLYSILLFYRIKSFSLNFISFCIFFSIYFTFISFQALRLCFSYPFTDSSEIKSSLHISIVGFKEKGIIKRWNEKFVRFFYNENLNGNYSLKVILDKQEYVFPIKIINKKISNSRNFLYEYYAKFEGLSKEEKYILIDYIFQKELKRENE